MSSISSLAFKHEISAFDHSHLSNSNGFVDDSDSELYRITLPDGSSHTFSDFESFENCFNAVDAYLKVRSEALEYIDALVLSPTRLSVAISEILGVSPYPVLYCGK